MKMKSLLIILSVCYFIFSCRSSDEGMEVVNPEKSLNLSDLNLGISFVPLDFGILGGIGEVTKFYFIDELLFVLDSEFTKGIHVFDLNGNLIRSIQSIEKLTIWDFIVDESNRELVLFTLGNKFERFTLDGNFIKSWKSEMPISKMMKLEDDKLFCDTGMESNARDKIFNLVILDPSNFKIKDFLLPLDEEPILAQDRVKNYALINNSDFLFIPPFDSKIYRVEKEGSIEPFLYFDFIDKLMSIQEFNRFLGDLPGDVTTGIDGLVYSNDKLFFHYHSNGVPNFRFFDLKSQNLYQLEAPNDFPSLFFQFFLMGYVLEKNDGLYAVIDLDHFRPFLDQSTVEIPDDLRKMLESGILFSLVKITVG
ncbi:6-bladed beta-propeller protein [Cecembia calidifontis]|uniref:6-bladed beta-propeller protein n=2 Tax=Cecembia calidifontis TaxID=1187080 RepID=A0A4Q7P3R4_9BACT|nr:6-bladed beta-propeller protein [Cecembia calidifontis]